MPGYKWEKVKYQSSSGLNLAGLLYSRKPEGTVVIVCHGFTGSKEGGGRAVTMAEEMGKIGYSTLLFDFGGCGESEGAFADISLTGHIDDLRSSLDFCAGLGFNRVITAGRSFGGTAVLCYGGLDGRVAGVCTWAAPAYSSKLFNSFRNWEQSLNSGLVSLTGEDGTVYVKEDFFYDLQKYRAVDYAPKISPRPLLVIHGSCDASVPLENARAIFNAAGEPREIAIIEGADHRFMGHHLEVWKIFFKWLQKHFPIS